MNEFFDRVCPSCGYSLKGIAFDRETRMRCPECGDLHHPQALSQASAAHAKLKLCGLWSAGVLSLFQILVWFQWFFGDPYAWLSGTFGLAILSAIMLVGVNLIDLSVRVTKLPVQFRTKALPVALRNCFLWNALPIVAWIVTAMFWASAVAAV
jgi:hypothetical protein